MTKTAGGKTRPTGAWTMQTNDQDGKKQGGKNMRAVTFKVCRFHLDDSCQVSAVHAHQITQYMKNMIGITSTRIHGQDIYVSYEPEEASAYQVKNYLCAAAGLYGSKWRNAIQRAFHHRYGENEIAAKREHRQSALKNQPVFKAGRSAHDGRFSVGWTHITF